MNINHTLCSSTLTKLTGYINSKDIVPMDYSDHEGDISDHAGTTNTPLISFPSKQPMVLIKKTQLYIPASLNTALPIQNPTSTHKKNIDTNKYKYIFIYLLLFFPGYLSGYSHHTECMCRYQRSGMLDQHPH
jgi:hypothetical protein